MGDIKVIRDYIRMSHHNVEQTSQSLQNLQQLVGKLGCALECISDIDCGEYEPIIDEARTEFREWQKSNADDRIFRTTESCSTTRQS